MEKIYEILQEIRPEVDFREASDFIEDEILDSLDIIKLVAAFEEEFSVTIDTEEIIPDNFESVEDMAKLISKLGGNI